MFTSQHHMLIIYHQRIYQIFKVIEAVKMKAGKYETPDIQLGYRYIINIQDANNELETTTIKLPVSTLPPHNPLLCEKSTSPVAMATISDTEHSYRSGVVLHPGYPTTEPVVGNVVSLFGKRFGVPFQNTNGVEFGRSISSLELTMCYSIDDMLLLYSHIFLGTYHVIDSLLPVYLPYNLIGYKLEAVERTNIIYDSFVYAAQDHSIAD